MEPRAEFVATDEEILNEPDVVAHKLASRFYAFFNYEPTDVPFSSARGEHMGIDVEKLNVG